LPSFSTDERHLLDESLQSYFNENYDFERWRQLARGTDVGYGQDSWRTYAELGWLGVAVPGAFGGAAGGITETGIVMAAAGRHMALEPLLGTIVLGAAAIELSGNAQQHATYLPAIIEGRTILAFCHAEPSGGFDRMHVKTVARRVDSGFVLDGEKSFTLGAHSADRLIVSARLGSATGPVTLFIVPGDSDGLHRNTARALDGRLGATLRLSGILVAAELRLGDSDADQLAVIDRIIDRGAIAACAEACGAMVALTQITVDYLKIREQFGQPLARFQVLQHRLVDMSIAAEEARAIVHAALQALDNDAPEAQRAVWRAKVKTARSARYVGTQAIQLHGGMGMTDELSVGHFYKRLTICETIFGDADWYLGRLGGDIP